MNEEQTQVISKEIIAGLTAQETSPEGRGLVDVVFSMQEAFFRNFGRYMGNDIFKFPEAVIVVWFPAFRGLEIGVDSYPEGFNIVLRHTHAESKLQHSRILTGVGPEPKEQKWTLITEY